MCFLNGRDKSPNTNLNGDFNRETHEIHEKKKTDYFSRHLAYFAVNFITMKKLERRLKSRLFLFQFFFAVKRIKLSKLFR